jgi:TorA maturation chaperone TorD
MAGALDHLEPDALDLERARIFTLLGRLLSEAPGEDLLARLAGLAPGGGAEATPLGRALAGLAGAASAARAEAVGREHFDLFIGVGRGELLPYASYYRTGFLYERPLAELRGDLARLGVRRAEGVAEPEDHIAFLCETMAGLLDGSFPGGPEAAAELFARHLRPWAGRFFADLEVAQTARFYRAVGALGRVVMEIEQAAAELPA